jgi:hypothetical protein
MCYGSWLFNRPSTILGIAYKWLCLVQLTMSLVTLTGGGGDSKGWPGAPNTLSPALDEIVGGMLKHYTVFCTHQHSVLWAIIRSHSWGNKYTKFVWWWRWWSYRCGDTVSELRLQASLLFIPQIIYEHGESWWYDINSRKQLIPPHSSLAILWAETSRSKGEELTKEILNLALWIISVHIAKGSLTCRKNITT